MSDATNTHSASPNNTNSTSSRRKPPPPPPPKKIRSISTNLSTTSPLSSPTAVTLSPTANNTNTTPTSSLSPRHPQISTLTTASTYRAPPSRGDTIHRLSRVFEQSSGFSDSSPNSTPTSPSSTTFSSDSIASAPSSATTAPTRPRSSSSPTPPSPNIVEFTEKSQDSRKANPQLRGGTVNDDEIVTNENTMAISIENHYGNTGEDEGIDQSHVSFNDLKARFQNMDQKSQSTIIQRTSTSRPTSIYTHAPPKPSTLKTFIPASSPTSSTKSLTRIPLSSQPENHTNLNDNPFASEEEKEVYDLGRERADDNIAVDIKPVSEHNSGKRTFPRVPPPIPKKNLHETHARTASTPSLSSTSPPLGSMTPNFPHIRTTPNLALANRMSIFLQPTDQSSSSSSHPPVPPPKNSDFAVKRANIADALNRSLSQGPRSISQLQRENVAPPPTHKPPLPPNGIGVMIPERISSVSHSFPRLPLTQGSNSATLRSSVKNHSSHSTITLSTLFRSNANSSDEETDRPKIRIIGGGPVMSSAEGMIGETGGLTLESGVVATGVGSTVVDPERKRAEKRINVLRELVETEARFANDMRLLRDVYCAGVQRESAIFDRQDVKALFSNLPQVISFSEAFLVLLRAAVRGDEKDEQENLEKNTDIDVDDEVLIGDESKTWVGEAFVRMMARLEETYSDYCKRHESAVMRLQELEIKPDVAAFLKRCQEAVNGKTKSWDLGSLLIKPVQREIRDLTLPDHLDRENVINASKEIQNVADRINEIKRRKDLVEKIVSDKRKEVNVVHGMTKTITRKTQLFKQVTGISMEATIDESYVGLAKRLLLQEERARMVKAEVGYWLLAIKENLEMAEQFTITLEEIYQDKHDRAHKLRKCFSNSTREGTRLLEVSIQKIYPVLDQFLEIYKNPKEVMKKREKKLLDYDRMREIKSKGGIPDKLLQESADAYVSINAQLVEELPKFLELSTQHFDFIIQEIVGIQAQFWRSMSSDIREYMFPESSSTDIHSINVQEEYQEAIQSVEVSLSELMVLRGGWASSSNTPSEAGSERGRKNWNSSRQDLVDGEYFRKNGGAASSTGTMRGISRSDPQGDDITTLGGNTLIKQNALDTDNVRTTYELLAPNRQNTGYHSNTSSLTSFEDQHAYIDDTPQPLFQCIALYPYDTTGENELAFDKDAIIYVWYEEGDGKDSWWYGERVDDGSGMCGWFPAAFCSRID